MKKYDFDETIDRKGTDCFKWDALPGMYGRDDLLPMWVADMDWRSPDFVLDALRRRCEHPVLGYTMPSEGYWQAVTTWLATHYNIHTTRESLHFIPGIVAGISYALLALTEPGDRVLVTTPVYPPFLNVPQGCGREVVCSPLKMVRRQPACGTDTQATSPRNRFEMVRRQPACGTDTQAASPRYRFEIDFDDFERRAEGCKVFIMSNPHNPAGTLWDKATLSRIADICERKGLLVISDEIHADLTLARRQDTGNQGPADATPARHVSYSTVSPAAAAHSLTFMAPSKTFNIAGLGSSVCCITDATLRKRFFGWLDTLGVAGGNIFAFTAAEAAFAQGEEWQRQMLEYLNGNVQALDRYLKEHLPLVKAMLPEASYLAWLDFSAYGIPHKELTDRFINEARVVMNDGTTFGPQQERSPYEGCFRLNVGCPRSQLLEALHRIENTINKQ